LCNLALGSDLELLFQALENYIRRTQTAAGYLEVNSPQLMDKTLWELVAIGLGALFAFCAADAEKERGPNAAPLSPERNLLLNTCLEIKLGHLQKFSQLAAYADFFFPERIASCGEQSRLPDQEKVLAPYVFLQIDEPKLYDFSRYNECLMTPKAPD
jgi:hypothetical protein